MRVLLLCDRYPDSYRDGLLLRVLHLSKRLRARHQIDLLCYHEGSVDGEPIEIFRHIWTVLPPSRQQHRGWLGVLSGWSPSELYPHSNALVRLLEQEIDPKNYDVVLDAGASMFLHLPSSWNDVPVVADLVDDMVLTFWRGIRSTSGLLSKLRIFKYLSVNLLYERYSMRRTAHCVVVSEDDAATFRMVSPTVPVSVIQNGVDVNFFTLGESIPIPVRLVFEGSMAFLPNLQAALFLVNEIMPRIWTKQPAATLTLVGRDPPPEILSMANDHVFVTGAVDDIRPYVWEAEVFVCPLQSGAGIKNKMLQAWAMGKAVVATSLSIGGLGASDGKNLLIRDGADEIAAAVLDLLERPEERDALGAQARATVETAFAWESQAERLESLLQQVLGEKHS